MLYTFEQALSSRNCLTSSINARLTAGRHSGKTMKLNPAISGKLTRVATGNLGKPLLSADGSTIVYNRWNGENWDIERVRDGRMEAVSKHPEHDLSPQISDSGDVVVWARLSEATSDQPSNWDVYRWNDGQESVVAASVADESEPQVSSDGRTIVYTYDDVSKTSGFDLHRCQDGHCEELTTSWPVDTEPQLSGDGKRVVFRRKVQFDGGDLWLKDIDIDPKPLTYDALAEQRPTLSRNGQVLAWSKSASRESDSDIFTYNLANGQREQIGEEGVEERDPALTSDGASLAYSRSDGAHSNIMLRTKGYTLPITVEGQSGWPALSSNGKVIAWKALDPEDSSRSVIYKFEMN